MKYTSRNYLFSRNKYIKGKVSYSDYLRRINEKKKGKQDFDN